jgi:hypothetical protein
MRASAGTRVTAVKMASHASAYGNRSMRSASVMPPTIVTSASVGRRNVIFGVNRWKTFARSSTSRPPRTGPSTIAMKRSMPVQSTAAMTCTYVCCWRVPNSMT